MKKILIILCVLLSSCYTKVHLTSPEVFQYTVFHEGSQVMLPDSMSNDVTLKIRSGDYEIKLTGDGFRKVIQLKDPEYRTYPITIIPIGIDTLKLR